MAKSLRSSKSCLFRDRFQEGPWTVGALTQARNKQNSKIFVRFIANEEVYRSSGVPAQDHQSIVLLHPYYMAAGTKHDMSNHSSMLRKTVPDSPAKY